MANKTKWIAIDGADAVGKSTQVDLLKKKLSNQVNVEIIPEFSASPVGKLIHEIIQEKEFFTLFPEIRKN